MKLIFLPLLILEIINTCKSEIQPKILSSLYGYNNCIGGVNNFETQDEYLEDLRNRSCTVENGRTNVVDHKRLILACYDFFQTLSWLDGMPVVFNFPLEVVPRTNGKDFQVELSDGSLVTPDCVFLQPADEKNERETVVLLGQFGDGPLDTVRPSKVTVVGDINLVTEEGPVSAKGLTYSNQDDMNYVESSVRMVQAKLWAVETSPENFRHPMWPFPSKVSIYVVSTGILLSF